MRNCIVVGSGRSGTSLLAGTLSSAGYYLGDDLIPATEENPKGFFEDREINSINEAVLAEVTPKTPTSDMQSGDEEIRWGWRWLASVPLRTQISCPSVLKKRIAAQTTRPPFCFKDPRFCYTLPVWRPFLEDTVYLCVFREPARTAQSMVTTVARGIYLHGLKCDFEKALEIWTLMYQHVLDVHRHDGTWMFLHFDQILDGSALPELERLLDIRIQEPFGDTRLKRSANVGPVSGEAHEVYRELCRLAGFNS